MKLQRGETRSLPCLHKMSTPTERSRVHASARQEGPGALRVGLADTDRADMQARMHARSQDPVGVGTDTAEQGIPTAGWICRQGV